MISHNHKCIFIHIAKCAGSTVENAFGVDIADQSQNNHKNFFGWDDKNKLYLQHATPQELLSYGLIDENTWNDYYKFVIVRNSWDKSISDYFWMLRKEFLKGSFIKYLNRSGKFKKKLTDNSNSEYRGDHLTKQIDYFKLNGKFIKYDKVLFFDQLKTGLPEVAKDLSLPIDFFDKKINVNPEKKHYSKYYSYRMIKKVKKIYGQDIKFFGFKFDDKRSFKEKVLLFLKLKNPTKM